MSKIEIKSSFSSKQLKQIVSDDVGELMFPLVVTVENLLPIPLVDSDQNILVLDSTLKNMGNNTKTHSFVSKESLFRFADNCLTITKLNDFSIGVIITIENAQDTPPDTKGRKKSKTTEAPAETGTEETTEQTTGDNE